MKFPLLSVIVPIYNVEQYLERCLESIIHQTYENYEVICVDDGSSDNSRTIASSYSDRDSRFRLIHKSNGGLVSARKAGIDIVKGDYIMTIDSDDWIESCMFDEMVSIICKYNADVVVSQPIRDYGGYQILTQTLLQPGLYTHKDIYELKLGLIDEHFFFRSTIPLHSWGKLYKADKYIFCQKQVPDKVSIGEGAALTIPYILNSQSAYVMDKGYYHYCMRSDSIMGRENSDNTETLDSLEIYFETIGQEFKRMIPNIGQQISIIMIYFNLFYNIEAIVNYDGFMLFPYGEVMPNERILVYGAGKFGVRLYRLLKKRGWFKSLVWADTEGKNGSVPIDIVDFESVDKIFVGAIHIDSIKSIVNELVNNKSVPNNKILCVNPLQ